ncbi:YncE family protein [Geomonas oryzae]|uniref:YncE family protein n=1 Tax=Geomonas oryzae TaxID=2364273 RepID=UPI00100AD26F|nr:YncE family protein [Geomonas oryzae]
MTFPLNVTYDSLHNKIYVSIVYGQKITVINAANDTVLKTIPYDTSYVNVNLACSATSGRLYAAEYIIDTATDTIVAKQKNLAARTVVHDPQGNKLYAMSDELLVINTLTGKMEKVVKIKNPYLAVVNPNGKKLFVLEEARNYVSIVDTTTYEIVSRVALPSNYAEGIYNSVSDKVYFFQTGSIAGTILDGETGVQVSSFYSSYYSDGKAVFQPATNKIYVGGWALDCATNTVLGTVPVKGRGTAAPDSPLIYFPYNGITVFDSATDQVVANFGSTLAGKENFERVAYDAAGNRLIAVNDTMAYVLDATSGAVLNTLPLPSTGVSQAFFNDSNKKTLVFRMFLGYSTIGGVCDLSDYATRGIIGGDAAEVALRVDTHDITGGATLFDAYSLRYSYEKLMPGQHIRFRVRSAATQEGLAAAKYVGPDGTAATWYDETASGALTNAEGTETVIPLFAMGTQAGRFIEIETALTANGLSPRLDEVKLELSAVASPTSASLQQLDEAGAPVLKPIKDATVSFRVSGIPAGYFAQFEIRPKGTPFTGESTATGGAADASGNSTAAVALPEGEYQWQARLALNADSWTAWTQFPGALTIDRTPPAMGIKGHTIMGTLEAGARVTVMAAAPLIVEPVQYPTATTWHCTVSNLAPGVNQVVVTVSDEAGNLTYTTLLLSGY